MGETWGGRIKLTDVFFFFLKPTHLFLITQLGFKPIVRICFEAFKNVSSAVTNVQYMNDIVNNLSHINFKWILSLFILINIHIKTHSKLISG